MSKVVSYARGVVPPERVKVLKDEYESIAEAGLPDYILQSFLVGSEPGHVAILTVWRSRQELDDYVASVEEPTARRLIREAGGTPEVTFYEVVASI